jgi:hypothetical protein
MSTSQLERGYVPECYGGCVIVTFEKYSEEYIQN